MESVDDILDDVAQLVSFLNGENSDIPTETDNAIDILDGMKQLCKDKEDSDHEKLGKNLNESQNPVLDKLRAAVDNLEDKEDEKLGNNLLDDLKDAVDRLGEGEDCMNEIEPILVPSLSKEASQSKKSCPPRFSIFPK